MSFMGLFDDDENRETTVEERVEDVTAERAVREVEDGRMRLREEELDVSKYAVQTGEVTLHKDIVEEQRTVHVPVTHEQVVIERHAVNEPSDSPVGSEEVIRIPVSEERVDVDKRTIVTGEVEVSKRAVEETREVNETVRKEVPRVDVDGHPEIVGETDLDLH